MSVEEIVQRVRSAIDEITANDAELSGMTGDTETMTRIIIDKIGYGLVYVLENAPLDKLDSGHFRHLSGEELSSCFSIVDGVGKLLLPDSVLRIVDARLSSWPYFPVPVLDSSQVALMQHDKYARGSWDRPVSVLQYDNGQRLLMMYCSKDAGDELLFTYIGKPDVSGISASDLSQDVDVPGKLEAALVYHIAGLVMTAYKDDMSGQLFNISKSYLDGSEVEGGV